MDDTLHNLLSVPATIQKHEVQRLAYNEGFVLSVITERYGNDTKYFTSIQRLDESKDHPPRDGIRFPTEIAALLNGLRIAREANSLPANLGRRAQSGIDNLGLRKYLQQSTSLGVIF